MRVGKRDYKRAHVNFGVRGVEFDCAVGFTSLCVCMRACVYIQLHTLNM